MKRHFEDHKEKKSYDPNTTFPNTFVFLLPSRPFLLVLQGRCERLSNVPVMLLAIGVCFCFGRPWQHLYKGVFLRLKKIGCICLKFCFKINFFYYIYIPPSSLLSTICNQLSKLS